LPVKLNANEIEVGPALELGRRDWVSDGRRVLPAVRVSRLGPNGPCGLFAMMQFVVNFNAPLESPPENVQA